MRTGLGVVVLVVGVGALGLWGRADHAKDMERAVSEAAAQTVGATRHGIKTEVSGRDIRVIGTAHTAAARDALLAKLDDVEGRRVVIMDDLKVLPNASPYAFTVTKTPEAVDLAGNVPDGNTKAVIIAASGVSEDGLELASGAPVDDWAAAVLSAEGALAPLENGTAVFTDKALSVTGLARTPAERTAAEELLAPLGETFALTTEIDVIDDGAPLNLSAIKDATGVRLVSGKLADGMNLDALGVASDDAVQTAGVDLGFEGWDELATSGLSGLSALKSGTLDITGTDVTLRGLAALPADDAAARAELAGLDADIEIDVEDDGTPFRFAMTKGPNGLSGVSGKLPSTLSLADLGDMPADADVATARIASPDGAFDARAKAGIAALGALKEGTLDIEGSRVSLRGLAALPSDASAVTTALNGLPEGTSVLREIDIEDDGAPFALAVTLSDGVARNVSGKLPSNMSAAGVLAPLGANVPDASGVRVARVASENGAWDQIAGTGVAALAELKEGTLTIENEVVTLTGLAALPGDVAAAQALLGNLPEGTALTTQLVAEDDGTPMRMTAFKDSAGIRVVDGKLPASMSDTGALVDLGAATVGQDVTIAQVGGDNTRFIQVAAGGIASMQGLVTGEMTLTGTDLSVRGTAATPTERDEALQVLSGLETIATVSSDIQALDDGTPLRLSAEKSAEGIAVTAGKLPQSLAAGDLTDLGAASVADDVMVSKLDDGTWAAPVAAAMDVLPLLETGTLEVVGNTVTVTGEAATPEVKADAEMKLSAIAGATVSADITSLDDGAPFAMTAEKGDEGVRVTGGKLPASLSLDAMGAGVVLDGVSTSRYRTHDGTFGTSATEGLGALAMLTSGALTVSETDLSLVGLAATAEDRDAATAALADLPVEVTTQIGIADDGTPLRMSAVRDATGTTVTAGKLPATLPVADLAGLGADTVSDAVLPSGLTDGEWGGLASTGIAALNVLDSGTMELTGRKLTVTGVAANPVKEAEVMATLSVLDLDTDLTTDITLLDDGLPFALTANQGAEGLSVTSGKLPQTMSAAGLSVIGADSVSDDVMIAKIGSENGQFDTAASDGLSALAMLRTGTLQIVGDDLELFGAAESAALKAAAEARLADTPGTVRTAIGLYDDGQPLRLSAVKPADAINVTGGKLPSTMGADALSDMGAATVAEAVVTSNVEDSVWNGRAAAGLRALASLEDGTLEIEGDAIRLTGTALSPQAEAQTRALLAGETAEVSVTLLDDGAPFALSAVNEAGGLRATAGRLPASMGADASGGLNGALVDAGVNVALINGDGSWPAVADQASQALAGLKSGTLEIADRDVTLTGLAATPADAAKVEGMMAALPAGYTPYVTLETEDDGTPFAMSLTKAEGAAARGQGKLPATLNAARIASVLGQDIASNDLRTARITSPNLAWDRIAKGGTGALALLERGQLDIVDTDLSITGVAASEADRAAARQALSAIEDVATVRAAITVPVTPVVAAPEAPAFMPSPAECSALVAAAQAGDKVSFNTGSAVVDADGQATVARIADVVQQCLEPGALRLEVEGHTDSQGTEANNQALSQARAEAVVALLVAAGVDADALTARGFGETQPIADNETAEGRATNRRTTLTWYEKGE